jgi:hypothetical protein
MSSKIFNFIKYEKLSDYGKTLFNYLFTKKKSTDKQILDPLTTVIKLALLYFYDNGTKLTIYNNSITLQEPDILQGTIRATYGNSRNTLHNIKEPIINCMRWFPYSRYEELKTIYTYAVKGLEKLKKNYDGMICDSIDNYINFINNNLIKMEDRLNSSMLEETVVLQDKLQTDIKKIWNLEEITLINTFFIVLKQRYENKDIENIENVDNKGLKNIMNSIIVFLNEKDEKVIEFLKEYITKL